MRAALCLLAALASGPATWAQGTARTAPTYSAASIVNSASNLPGALAPNTIATLYGKNLSYSTRGVSAAEPRRELGGVHVTVGGLVAGLYYVSPEQINFLIPNELKPGEVAIRVTRDGLVGDPVWIKLLEAAPGLFQQDAATVLATHHPDWAVVTPEQPAEPSGWVILWAVGLGRTSPDVRGVGEIVRYATPIQRMKDFRVLINGEPVEEGRIGYAGLAPGYAGLYQINLHLPDPLPSDPEIQIALGEQVSQSLRLPSRDRN